MIFVEKMLFKRQMIYMNCYGLVNYRASQYFAEVEKLHVEGVIGSGKELELEKYLQQARQWAEERAETLFLEYRNEIIKNHLS